MNNTYVFLHTSFHIRDKERMKIHSRRSKINLIEILRHVTWLKGGLLHNILIEMIAQMWQL